MKSLSAEVRWQRLIRVHYFLPNSGIPKQAGKSLNSERAGLLSIYRNVRIVPEIETPGQLRIFFSIRNIDAGSLYNIKSFGACALLQPERPARYVQADFIQAFVDPQRPAELARTARQVGLLLDGYAPVRCHPLRIGGSERLHRADQYRMRIVLRGGNHIEAVVHAVYEIYIGGAAGAEHHFGSGGAAASISMAAFVFGASVAFRFHDAAAYIPVFRAPDQMLAKKKRRGPKRCMRIDLRGQKWRRRERFPAAGSVIRIHRLMAPLPGEAGLKACASAVHWSHRSADGAMAATGISSSTSA